MESPATQAKAPSFFEQLQKAMAEKRKFSTIGKANKPLRNAAAEALAKIEAEATKLHNIVDQIKAKNEWRLDSVCIHVLHSHCSCGSSTHSDQGLLLRQVHVRTGVAKYTSISSMEGLNTLSKRVIHRQQRIHGCSSCFPTSGLYIEYGSGSDPRQLPLPF